MTDKHDKPGDEGIWESTSRIWLAGLAAFSRAQEEGGKLFDTLVQEGEEIQQRSRERLDASVNTLVGRANHTWGQLGQVFEDQIAQTLDRLGVPTRQDIDELSQRIEDLQTKLDEQQK